MMHPNFTPPPAAIQPRLRASLDADRPIAPRLLDALTSPWAIIPEKLLEIQAIYFTHLRGEKIDLSLIEASTGKKLENEQKPYQVVNGVAVIEIDGIIAKKMNLFTRISGGVSTQLLKSDIMEALADPQVSALLLNIDSPGGTVDGTEELASAVYAARSQKPVVAFTDGLMASAAYWIGAAADLICISGDTPVVGSVGVVTSHTDYSKWEEQAGIKTTEIYAGKYKRIASEHAPLSQEGRAYLQDQVDYLYGIFVKSVNASRPESLVIPDEGPITWADGKLFTGRQAIDNGLVDGVSTKDALIERLGSEPKETILRARLERETQAILQRKKGGTL